MNTRTVLVTGATGFVGRALIDRLIADGGRPVRAAVRAPGATMPDGVSVVVVGGIDDHTDWSAAVEGVDTVIHTAARVHVMQERAADPLAAFRVVNVDGTLRLARAAAAAGVRRFVFVSSIKVNGEETPPGRPYAADDPPTPVDPYGVSKLEAERGLEEIGRSTSMEIAIVRPVLVYGPGVRANFRAMMRLVQRGIPLPLGTVHNRRSLVALHNLVDLLVVCVDHPAAANQAFLVSDGEDVSTTELIRRIAKAMGRSPRLFAMPSMVLQLGARLLGQATVAQRLCGSLQVDIEKTRRLLGWRPPVDIDTALAETVRHFARYDSNSQSSAS